MSQVQEGQLTDEILGDGELTQEQLALLNNLMYLADITKKNDITLGKYLDTYTENDYKKVDNLPGGLTEISHADWKDIINTVQNDEKLRDLIITNTMADEEGGRAICLVDSNLNATAVFRGTGEYEWIDNADGCDIPDSVQQKNALNWINGLSYDNITTSGHSKGGNKAQYTLITSDKVTRCVAFDGQGFSEEFCEKYSDEIAEKRDKITLISAQGDFVNGLYLDIAGDIVYLKSGETTVDKFSGLDFLSELLGPLGVPSALAHSTIAAGQEHIPNAFLTTKNGKVQFSEVTEQDPVMKLLHNYIEYFTVNSSKEDKEYISALIMNMIQGEAKKIEVGNPPIGFKERMEKLNSEWLETLNITKEEQKVMFWSLMNGWTDVNKVLSYITNKADQTMVPSLYCSIRDFSTEAKEKLIASIINVEGDNPLEYKRWATWNALSEEVKSKIDINYCHRSIYTYYSELTEKNNSSIQKINNIFEKVYQIDKEYSSKLNEQCGKLKAIEESIKKLTESFDTGSIEIDLSAVKSN